MGRVDVDRFGQDGRSRPSSREAFWGVFVGPVEHVLTSGQDRGGPAEPGSEARTLAARFCDAPLLHENLRVNLPGYIRFLFEGVLPASIALDRHFRKARSLGLYTARYEDMLDRGEETLTGIVEHLSRDPADPQRVRDTLELTSFERHTGRKRGEEDVGAVVARKGIAGDWKNQFTSEAARTFDRLAGELLIESGYETDHGWIDQVVETDDVSRRTS